MITVTTRDELAGVRLTLQGHASDDFGDEEKSRFCAGVSTLLATLLLELDGDLARGADGHVDVVIPRERASSFAWLLTGLGALARGYPGHLMIDQHDTGFRRHST